MIAWLHLVIGVIAGGALLGVGLALVRPADKSAGFVLAGAGGAVLLGSCCLRVGALVGEEAAAAGGLLAATVTDLLAFVLIAVAGVLVARALGRDDPSWRRP